MAKHTPAKTTRTRRAIPDTRRDRPVTVVSPTEVALLEIVALLNRSEATVKDVIKKVPR